MIILCNGNSKLATLASCPPEAEAEAEAEAFRFTVAMVVMETEEAAEAAVFPILSLWIPRMILPTTIRQRLVIRLTSFLNRLVDSS